MKTMSEEEGELTVVARLKAGGTSRSMKFSELWGESVKCVPVDKVYFVEEVSGGMRLREAGQVVLSFVPVGEEVRDGVPVAEEVAKEVSGVKKRGKGRPRKGERTVEKRHEALARSVVGEVKVDKVIPASGASADEFNLFGKVPH